ncbi:hypothetical protein KSP39_PZI005581 [Platanthera zijinensis]|uniref:Uncharacterized protein n=1 Tax=Platanthera zijinensis TaxID=2320716 RepID=A0AAP0BSV4_9ASPA
MSSAKHVKWQLRWSITSKGQSTRQIHSSCAPPPADCPRQNQHLLTMGRNRVYNGPNALQTNSHFTVMAKQSPAYTKSRTVSIQKSSKSSCPIKCCIIPSARSPPSTH